MDKEQSNVFTVIRSQDIMAIAVLAVLSFAIDTTMGLVFQPFLVMKFGPLTGGLVSAIPNAVVIFLGGFLIPRLGAPTLYAFIFLSFTTFTASFGPPGFHKIFIGLALGVTIEVILVLFRRKVYAYFIAVAAAFGLSVDFTYLSWVIFAVGSATDAKAFLRPILPQLTVAYAILGIIGSSIAYWIYKKRLASYNIIQKLRSGK